MVNQGQIPSKIGRYEVLDRLAAGGMAEIFLGRYIGEKEFERLVAIKRILPHLAGERSFVEMFIDEARICSMLSHAGIAQVFDFGKTGSTHYLAMEYIQGIDFRIIYSYLSQRGRPAESALAAYLVAQVCGALEYAHAKTDQSGKPLGIIHRDVSPSNVLVSFEGQVKLIDFGIARAAERLHETMAGSLKGKFAYMSPEQAFGKGLDNRSDIFNAGILLFELLTMNNPFVRPGDNELATLERVRLADISQPSSTVAGLPPEVERICLKALARDPGDRYRVAGEMQEDLEAFCHELSYGNRQFSLWMKETFSKEREASFNTLQRLLAGDRVPATDLHERGTKILVPSDDEDEKAAVADVPLSRDDIGADSTMDMKKPRGRKQKAPKDFALPTHPLDDEATISLKKPGETSEEPDPGVSAEEPSPADIPMPVDPIHDQGTQILSDLGEDLLEHPAAEGGDPDTATEAEEEVAATEKEAAGAETAAAPAREEARMATAVSWPAPPPVQSPGKGLWLALGAGLIAALGVTMFLLLRGGTDVPLPAVPRDAGIAGTPIAPDTRPTSPDLPPPDLESALPDLAPDQGAVEPDAPTSLKPVKTRKKRKGRKGRKGRKARRTSKKGKKGKSRPSENVGW